MPDDSVPHPRRRRRAVDDEIVFQRIRRRSAARRQPPPPPPQQDSTYFFSTHGPSPVPDWVITEDAAMQYELGVLKTGKEADVFLVERVLGERRNLLAAKRYRSREHREFENDALYRERIRTGNRRVDLAIAQGSRRGMEFRAKTWADHEFEILSHLWLAGLPVPYPVQQRGTELVLEYFGDDDFAAPRLADVDLGGFDIADLVEQAVDMLFGFARAGVVHGDLSPFNVLVAADRLVAIDFPQAVHPDDADGIDLLRRDTLNLVGWFAQRGAPVDTDAVFASLVRRVYPRRRS